MATPTKHAQSQAIARQMSADDTAESPVVQSLRRQVANALLLYLNYKHYHWQTYGPLFREARLATRWPDPPWRRRIVICLVVIKEMREAAKLADEHRDPGTMDLLSKFVQIHEKHEWWARDILRHGDGFTA